MNLINMLLELQPKVSFDLTTVTISILGSSLAAAVVSYFTAVKLKKREFDFEHKKYIIKRRLNAYESIEPFASEIYNGITITSKNELSLPIEYSIKRFFYWTEQEKNPFSQFFFDFYNQAMKEWYWYTPEFRKKLNRVFGIFGEIRSEFEKSEMKKEDLIDCGKRYHNKLHEVGLELAKQMMKDLPNMHIMQILT